MLNNITQAAKIPLWPASLKLRLGAVADSYDAYVIFRKALADLTQRIGLSKPEETPNSEALARAWAELRPLFEHLARTAEHFWVAEQGGRPVGYVRSIANDGIRELTEFFILPEAQSAGVGGGRFAGPGNGVGNEAHSEVDHQTTTAGFACRSDG